MADKKLDTNKTQSCETKCNLCQMCIVSKVMLLAIVIVGVVRLIWG